MRSWNLEFGQGTTPTRFLENKIPLHLLCEWASHFRHTSFSKQRHYRVTVSHEASLWFLQCSLGCPILSQWTEAKLASRYCLFATNRTKSFGHHFEYSLVDRSKYLLNTILFQKHTTIITFRYSPLPNTILFLNVLILSAWKNVYLQINKVRTWKIMDDTCRLDEFIDI